MAPAATKPEPIHLTFRDANTPVLVEAENEDRFFTTVREAAAACQAADKEAQFSKQLRDNLFTKLRNWLRKQTSKVEGAYLAIREGGLLFLVVRSDTPYDRQFEDDLTALDAEIATDPSLSLVALDVMALPHVSEETAMAFLGSKKTLAVFTRA